MNVLVEGCVTSVAEALRCEEAGACRLELCEHLEVGGVTPSPGLVREVCAAVSVPVFVMVRPRAGDYAYTRPELDGMVSDAEAMVELGAAGLVTGVLDGGRRPDGSALRALVDAAGSVPVTFHRAFDDVPDREAALDLLVEVGVARVLTSGGAGSALEGKEALERLVHRAAGRITILAGGRVRGDHAAALVRATGVTELHARAEAIPDLVRALSATS